MELYNLFCLLGSSLSGQSIVTNNGRVLEKKKNQK